MKVSLNWIKEYLDFDLPPVDELVQKIGAQLGAVEEVIDLGKKYQGIIIVKVVSVANHPNADRLHVCKIDDSGKAQNVERDENGHVQVVCGAPNVREGLMVAWLPPGSTVPATADTDPFVLEARELRGVVSNGMLASAKELAVSDNHEGIAELEAALQPGADFAEAYKLNDHIIDIENKMFTHRPDLFGQLGVAREIAGITGHQFTSPEWYVKTVQDALAQDGGSLPLEVRNEIPGLVPRFMAVALSNIEVKPSPMQLQTWLSRVGIRPINNVVDITNYMMMLTAQPMHAYDYDKVKAQDGAEKATIVVRNPHSGEKLTLLNGKEIEPRREAIMIATEQKLIGLGGVMGGSETEVDEHTKNLILECATFDMYSIRKTAMAHGIFSDAVTRFNKGQSALQNDKLLAKALELLRGLAGGKVASSVIDDDSLGNEVRERNSLYPTIPVSASFINERLGLQLPAADMGRLLANVECHVEAQDDNLTVKAPFWRTDIEQREDVVEEVGRLYGFDHLPLELPQRDVVPTAKDSLLETKRKIRAILSAAGANEVLTYSFVHSNLLDKVGQDKSQAYQLSNALSPDLQYYRLSLIPSLLEKVRPNIKAGYDEFALFEIGKAHTRERGNDQNGLPAEDEYTALVLAANDKLQKTGSAYYRAQKYLTELVGVELEFKPITAEAQTFAVMRPYQPGGAALVSVKATGKFLGIIGEFKPSVARELKLPKYCAGFELDTTALQEVLAEAVHYTPLPRFPKVEQDISLKVPAELSYQELYQFICDELVKVRPEQTYMNVTPLDIYQREDDKAHKQVAFRLTIASYEKTMTDQEVNGLLDAAAQAAHDKFGAERL